MPTSPLEPKRGAAPLRAGAEKAAARLPALRVAAERLATTVAQGMHGRRTVGPGVTFWQFRPFAAGDQVSAIDWRRSAKSDPLFVREREWEAAASVYFWRDPSASMDYCSGHRRAKAPFPTKGERGDVLLLALALLLVRGEEQVAPLVPGARAMGGGGGIDRLANALAATLPNTAWPRAESLPRFAHVVIAGDFLAPVEEIEHGLKPFSDRGARLHIVEVLDPAEEDLPFRGRVLFADPESGDDLLVNRVDAVKDEYRGRLLARRVVLSRIARATGGSHHLHLTDRPPEQTLMALFAAIGDTGLR